MCRSDGSHVWVANEREDTVSEIANEASTLSPCEGSNIRGKGSSAQNILQQEIWNVQFNTDAEGCSGKLQPKVSYESTGSGPGLESWGVEQRRPGEQELWFGAKNAFLGTERAPNAKQEEEILSHGPGGAKVLTIPVAQPAIAILVHLPDNCSAEGEGDSGRLQFTQKGLEKVFEGTAKWAQIVKEAKATLRCENPECPNSLRMDTAERQDGHSPFRPPSKADCKKNCQSEHPAASKEEIKTCTAAKYAKGA